MYADLLLYWCVQRFYEGRQYKKAIRAADTILKSFPNNGGQL